MLADMRPQQCDYQHIGCNMIVSISLPSLLFNYSSLLFLAKEIPGSSSLLAGCSSIRGQSHAFMGTRTLDFLHIRSRSVISTISGQSDWAGFHHQAILGSSLPSADESYHHILRPSKLYLKSRSNNASKSESNGYIY